MATSDISFNFVSLVEDKPIQRLSQEYNNKFISKIKETFTETQQNLYISSLYCYLNYHPTNDYIIDLDNIWKWLGFSQKVNAKSLLEKNFVIEKDYKLLLLLQQKQDKEQHGGHNKQIFMLNIRTFKRFCLKAGTQKSNEIHDYFINLEEIYHQLSSEESIEKDFLLQKSNEEKKELENKLIQSQEENKQLQVKEEIPMIYIYNIDTNIKPPQLKIGFTKNVNNRIKQYKQISKFGKLEFHIEVIDYNIRTVENFIHHILKKYRIEDEVFRIDVDEAIKIINRIVNTLKTINITDDVERNNIWSKLYDVELAVINNDTSHKVATREMSTQTCDEDFPETPPPLPPTREQNELTQKFDKFIEDHCIVREDVEVSSVDIIGQYRIIAKSASKEVYSKLKSYLDTRFKPARLQYQNKNQVVNGYKGVMLRELKYTKNIIPSHPQNFIFHACTFSPSGKALFSELVDEYKKWKQNVNIEILSDDGEQLKKYLNSKGYCLYGTLWCGGGGGQGFYGICLKKDEIKHKTTSSTGKKVEKRCVNTDELLSTYETIAKAAEIEEMCAAKMSRSIKNRIVFGDYYYCTSTN